MSRLRSTLHVAAAATVVAAFSVGSPSALAAPDDPGSARFSHFASSEQAVDLDLDGSVAATGVALRSVTDSLSVSPGTHQFAIKPTAQPAATSILGAGVPADGAVTIGAVPVRDAAALSIAPVGGVQTNYGTMAMASAPEQSHMWMFVLAGAVGACGVLWTIARRVQQLQQERRLATVSTRR